jgi:hypothetical protein
MSTFDEVFPKTQVEILKKIWGAKALGRRDVTRLEIERQLSRSVGPEEVERHIQDLASKLLISQIGGGPRVRISLTSLGVALVRQLEENDLKSRAHKPCGSMS